MNVLLWQYDIPCSLLLPYSRFLFLFHWQIFLLISSDLHRLSSFLIVSIFHICNSIYILNHRWGRDQSIDCSHNSLGTAQKLSGYHAGIDISHCHETWFHPCCVWYVSNEIYSMMLFNVIICYLAWKLMVRIQRSTLWGIFLTGGYVWTCVSVIFFLIYLLSHTINTKIRQSLILLCEVHFALLYIIQINPISNSLEQKGSLSAEVLSQLGIQLFFLWSFVNFYFFGEHSHGLFRIRRSLWKNLIFNARPSF